MQEIIEANESHLPAIQHIARLAWEATYTEILTREQIEYMFDWMYSIHSMLEQMKAKGHRFLIAGNGDSYTGFVSFEKNYKNDLRTKIHKLYVLPDVQKSGTGRALVDAVAEIAKASGDTYLSLNVNRFNKAQGFYKKLGFDIIAEEDIDIGHGYLMEDYIMEKAL
jgi:ribosomal protein S18 acetylase RimI-like enzyme